ncbi:thiolase C-terminal domain-containing protein [Frateuria aurantia]
MNFRHAAPAAISGLGMTPMGKVFGRTATDFAVEAIRLALADAGLAKHELDGLLINTGTSSILGQRGAISLDLQNALGLRDLGLLNVMNAFGSTAAAMVQFAAMAIASGMVRNVACVFADAPLQPGGHAGAAYSGIRSPSGLGSLDPASGLFSTHSMYALAAQRHMAMYGTTSQQLGEIAVSTRQWATLNPAAQMREPITLDDHQRSRMISDPLHLLDCCLVSNGGVAIIISSVEQAADLRQPPVYLHGWGQGHPGQHEEALIRTGAVTSGRRAMEMAGITPADVDICELYDCFTYTTLVTLEDYGFCPKGEGGRFVEGGRLGPGGALPTNTGGGQLSSYYMWGMTPLSEAVIQARGHAGDRQVPQHEVILVSGNGGVLSYHSTLVLSPSAR